VAFRVSRGSADVTVKTSDKSATDISSSSDLPIIKGSVLRERAEGISYRPPNPSASTSAPFSSKMRNRKAATATHHQNALQELLEVWNSKSKQENHSAEDRFQLLELRDKILRLSEYDLCKI
jgi:hypothetical protein